VFFISTEIVFSSDLSYKLSSVWILLQSKKKIGLKGFKLNAWKARVFNILEESDLDELVTRVMEEPTSNAGREAYKKRQAKAKRVIFDSIKDSMMPIIAHLRKTKECFDSLANLYEKKAHNLEEDLEETTTYIKNGKDETIYAFFSKISQTRDQLATIGVAVDDDDFVQTIVDGLPKSWETLLSSVNGR
jgi:hypothetical protein